MPSIDTILEQQARLAEANEIGMDTSRYMPRSDYEATAFSNDKYNVKGLSYPQDIVDSPEYGGNKVIFYINVSVDSKVLKTATAGGAAEVVEGVQRNQRGALISQGITGLEAGAAAATAGVVAAALGGQFLGIDGGTAKAAIAGGIFGGGTAAIIASNVNNQESAPGQIKEPTFSRPQKRLKAAIALYTPNQLSVRYSSTWGEEDTMGFAALTKGGNELKRAFTGDADLARTGGLAKDIISSLSLSGKIPTPFGTELGIASGLASNPKKEQAFKNVDFRTFTFEYQFAPRDAAEAQNVLNIIRAFKYHMHPEFKDDTGFLYIYPSEFDIVYYNGTTENLNIHRHTSCVLTEMNVNYTPNGVFNTFSNGMPTQINITLTFRELMLLTKEAIARYA